MRWLALLGVACSSGQRDDGTTADTDLVADADTDLDVDTDADTDADTDTDTHPPPHDTGFDPYQDPQLRALHVAVGVPGQDMFGNGLPGNPPLVDLTFLEGTPLVARPPGQFEFTFVDVDGSVPWASFPYSLSLGSFTSFVVIGTPLDRQVVVFDEPVTAIPFNVARVRWTHAAPSLVPNAVLLRDVGGGPDYAGGASIAYGTSVVTDEQPGMFEVWIDLDADGSCGPGEAFAPFERAGGEFHHLLITDDEDGALQLVSHSLSGVVFIGPIAPEQCP